MRKIGESIIINDNIEVRVVEIKGRSVKLGFDSPPDVTILRKEIQERIIQENLAAAKGMSEAATMNIPKLNLPDKGAAKLLEKTTDEKKEPKE